jgi:hypothetical protein
MPTQKVCDECAEVCEQRKNRCPFRRQRFLFGGLGRNRTTDTRIFNCRIQLLPNVYAVYSLIPCYVLQNVLQLKHRIS